MTGEPTQTFVNPAAALEAASRLTQTGADFVTQYNALKSRIEGYHNDAPWGTDEVGVQFAEKYLPAGEEEGARGVLSGISSLGETLSQVGPIITDSVTGTVATDDETGRSMQA